MLTYTPRSPGCLVDLETPGGLSVTVTVASKDSPPVIEGDAELTTNAALMTMVLAFAANEFAYRRFRSPEKRASHKKASAESVKEARLIVRMIERLGDTYEAGWCSGCFEETQHRHVKGAARPWAKFLCQNCGTPTTNCAVPRCAHFGVVQPSARTTLSYCAEHNHQVPSFGKLGQRLASIDDFEEWLNFEKRNAGRLTKVAGGTVLAAAVVAPLALLAAPVVGAALGGSALGGGLSGAAATSHGLAMLGGGSVAAGGLGMAGGTVVVTATGSAIGGALGAAATTAYVGSDKSFRIEKLRDGDGTRVLIASGFLSEDGEGWGGWRRIIDERYPEAPVYMVRWGAKELKDLGGFVGAGGVKVGVHRALVQLGKRGNKAFGALPGLGAVFAAREVVVNPWTVAKTRAGMTGAILAELIGRTDEEQFVLVGHSLGARVMVTAAQTLGTRQGKEPKIAAMHLLGAAVGNKGNWGTLDAAVSGTVWNYRSQNDKVLKVLYAAAEFGSKPVGLVGFQSKFDRIKDRDVSRAVAGHSEYVNTVRLVT